MKSFKQLTVLLCILGLGAAGFSCSGNTDDDPAAELTLKPSAAAITANGSDAVTFKVTDGASDVTAEAEIRCTTDNTAVENASFSTTVAGEYLFQASYGGRTSKTVKVTAKADETPSGPSQFVRQICVMEFTGQWCANCPAGFNYMNFIISRNFPDAAHVIALHDNGSGSDEFAIDIQKTIARDYGLTGYPMALVDMRDLRPLTADTDQSFKKSLQASLDDYPAHCGVAVKSMYDAAGKKAKVTVRVHSEKTETYRVAVWIIEDGLSGTQNVGGQYQDYTHSHVARLLAGSAPNNYKGESLGEIPANTEKSKEFDIAVDPAWNLDNTSVYALAIGADGYVNNMNLCKIVDGDADYERVAE